MGGPTILVVQHDADDHLNELAAPLLAAGCQLELWFAPGDGEPARDAADYDGILSLGSGYGVNDEPDLPWMPAERKVMTTALAEGLPLLGICFGAQLLASVAGGSVRRAEVPEIGWSTVQMSAAAAADPVLSTLGPTPEVFQFHFDTFELPAHVEVLGRTGATNEAFRVGERAWGVQFHIEIGPAAMHSWLATFAAEVDAVGVDREQVRAETVTRWAAHRRLTTAFGAAFAAQVAR